MSSDMRECPFCGNKPRSGWQGTGVPGMDDCGYWGIDCCNAFAHADTEAEALAQWNRRSDAPNGSWLWCKLMDFCQKRRFPPAEFNDLFAIVTEAHELNNRELLARTEAGADECEVCKGAGTVDEMLGGYAFSNPKATCPECDGLGEYTHPKNAAPVADGAVARLIRPAPLVSGTIQKFPTKTGATTVIPLEECLSLPPGEYLLYTHPHDASAREADRESLLSYKEIVHRLASTREGCIELAKVVHRELDFIDRCITDAIARCEAAAALPSPPKEKEAK